MELETMSYSTVKLAKVDAIDKQQIDSAAGVMVQNDNSLLPQSGVKPTIWCCRWYNTPLSEHNKSSYCYSKGDMVWLNTEDLEQFALSNKDYIVSVAKKNSILAPLLDQAQRGGTSELVQFLEDVTSGKITGNSDKLPLYCIGDILQPAKIRVSLSANNDHLPTDNGWWRDFFVDTNGAKLANQLESKFYELLDNYCSNHLKQYHLSGIQDWWREQNGGASQSLSSQFLLKDFSNVTDVQEYQPAPGTTDNGLDYVVYYHHKFYGNGDTCKWFRVWKSGYLEHGGVVKNEQAVAVQMEDAFVNQSPTTMRYNCYEVNLAWKYNNGTATAPSYTYPTALTGFYYDDCKLDFGGGEAYAQEKTSLQLDPESRYSVQVTPLIRQDAAPYATMHVSRQNAKWYMSREVNTMCNSSFRFILDDDVEYYSYKVTGFSQNAQQGF